MIFSKLENGPRESIAMTHEEAYQEARRRIAEARAQRLVTLDLKNLLWDRIPPELFKLVWLERLDIGRDFESEGGMFTQLPAEFRNLKVLQVFNIAGRRIADLTPLAGLTQLEELNCGSNWLTDLAPLAGLTQLRKLYCRSNQLTDFAPLAGLTQLQTLYCGGNQLTDLTPLAGLTQLQTLHCQENPLTDLTPLGGLSQLQTLHCTSNRLPDLTPLGGLTQLRELGCRGNQLTDLAPLAGLTQLRELDCGGNQLTDLMPLAGLTQLQGLDCGDNWLTDLAPLAGLTQLRELYCRSNQLTDLMPLAGLTQLQRLDCNYNQLTDLAPLAGLTRLQRLVCSDNQLTDLEPVRPLICAGQIKSFVCDGNPVGRLPAELLGSGNVAEVLRGYWRELEQGSEPNRDVKIILVGNGQVGKTTLVHGLKHGQPSPHAIAERTHGIVITELPLELAQGETLRLRLWDCGGQELYHATHRLFLHHDALYLLLWAEETDEPPEEPSHPVSYWLGHIRELAGESPVILVKNKIDRFNQRAHPPDLEGQPWPFKHDQKISAQTYEGVGALRSIMKDVLKELRHRWGYRLPASWRRVRDQLAERVKKKTLSHPAYLGLCQQQGVNHPEILLDYLHKSGFLFYHPGRFGDALILDQNWIINIIYRLFDPNENIRHRLGRQRGEFSGADTADFWPGHDQAEREVFLNYLLGCEMIFPLEDRWGTPFAEQQFVLPAMLPPEPPPGVKLWQAAPSAGDWWLDFRYRFLHRGLIERIIVRTAYLSPERDWWRDGILLEDPASTCALLLHYKPGPRLESDIHLRLQGGQSDQKIQARDKVQNLLQKLHPQNPPTIFVSPNGEHFVALEGLEKGQPQVITREGEIVDSQDYQVFRQRVDSAWRFEEPARREAPVRIFISYAHEDEGHRDRLEVCFKNLKRHYPIQWFHDRQAYARVREECTDQLLSELRRADMVCLLISPDFKGSDFCYHKELTEALEKHFERGDGVALPIIVRRTYQWQKDSMGQPRALPTDGKPLSDWPHEDDFWESVTEGIGRSIEEIRRKRGE